MYTNSITNINNSKVSTDISIDSLGNIWYGDSLVSGTSYLTKYDTDALTLTKLTDISRVDTRVYINPKNNNLWYQKYNDYSTVKYDQIANSEVVFPYDYEHVSLVGDFIFDSNGNAVFINRNEQLTAWINKP